jgi:hypothetical protein
MGDASRQVFVAHCRPLILASKSPCVESKGKGCGQGENLLFGGLWASQRGLLVIECAAHWKPLGRVENVNPLGPFFPNKRGSPLKIPPARCTDSDTSNIHAACCLYVLASASIRSRTTRIVVSPPLQLLVF